MADSDNTTTSPLVTRRQLLAGTAITVAGWKRNGLDRNDFETGPTMDPSVAVWRQWRDSNILTEQLCHQQQRLERKLLDTVGFPCMNIRLRGGERVTLHSLAALHGVLDPEDVALRAKAESDLAAHQARWDEAAKETGYSAALQAEREAADRSEDLLEALSQTPATTLAGVAAKLDAVLQEGEAWEDSGEFPWPQIRSALEDIDRIARHSELCEGPMPVDLASTSLT
ncbi:hypothetical protein ASD99_21525 [Mesorhizobium sp. Root695]|uniref:hypothetical protein n=1 Tax=Mesorhizobium sp. Root695 TaxID=1736589 RepID=UPI00070A7C99|nr:hypothetical protein [Mesorhizobium sp. Root695]KRB31060.1 hypothetical protein ASD99_21525 [Mesorhizobium sp. Root695]